MQKNKKYLDDKKIAFITCVNDEEMYEESLLYLHHLEVPKPYTIEYIKIVGAKSMTLGYNEGMEKSSARYKIYLHQDVLIIYKKFLLKMLETFQDADIGLLGLIGAKKLPTSAIWWDSTKLLGKVIHESLDDTPSAISFQNPLAKYEEVEALDGLLLASQYDLKWREDFDDFHFYDLAACKEFQRQGLKTVVLRQKKPYAIHLTLKKNLSFAYHKARKHFLKVYKKERDKHQ